jgi:transcriptional regulator of acetoin/glycerol metabolism
MARDAACALFAHGWPLNVRELEQALRSAVAISAGPALTLEDLQLASSPGPAATQGESLDVERLKKLMRDHAGNVSAVARELLTSRTQVQRLLVRHGLSCNDFRSTGSLFNPSTTRM